VSGNAEAAKAAVKEARKHEYRLKERNRFRTRAMGYQLNQQYDKLVPLHEQWVEIYPTDGVALEALANTYLTVGNRVEDALAIYRRLLAIDPGEDDILLRMAQLLQTKGENVEALEHLQRYANAHPGSERAQILIGQLHWGLGAHVESRAAFEKASVLVPGQVMPQIYLGLVDMAEGHIKEAAERYRQAGEEATTPGDKFIALQNLAGCYLLFGRIEDFSELLPVIVDLGSRSLPPVQFIPLQAALYTRLRILQGDLDGLQKLLFDLKSQLSPPLDVLVDLSLVEYFLAIDDPASAEQSLLRFQGFLETSRLDILNYLGSQNTAKIMAHRKENTQAAELLGKAIEEHAGSILSNLDLLSPLEMLVLKGRAHREAGESKQAEASLEEALRRFPAYPEAHLELARLYRDRPSDARKQLNRLVDELWKDADSTFEPLVEAKQLLAKL
jgi:tetratricopeptide (TPR) repeat protein